MAKKNRKQARINRQQQRQKTAQLKKQQKTIKSRQQAGQQTYREKIVDKIVSRETSFENALQEDLNIIYTIDLIRDRLMELRSDVYKNYETGNRNNYLVQILDDNYTQFEQEYIEYLKKIERELSFYMNKIIYESDLEEVNYSYAQLGRMLNMGIYSERMAEELSYMSEFD